MRGIIFFKERKKLFTYINEFYLNSSYQKKVHFNVLLFAP